MEQKSKFSLVSVGVGVSVLIGCILLSLAFPAPLSAQQGVEDLEELKAAFSAGRFPVVLRGATALRARCMSEPLCDTLERAEADLLLVRVHLAEGRPDSVMYYIDEGMGWLREEECDHRNLIAANLLLKTQCMAQAGDLEGAERVLLHVANDLGDDPKVLANALVNLGNVAILRESFAQGQSYLLQAKDLMTAAYGPSHPMVARCLHNLASIADKRHDWPSGERYLGQSLSLKQAVMGPNHPELITTLVNLGVNLLSQGRPVEAIPLLQRAEAISIATMGPENSQLRPILMDLATACAEAGSSQVASDYVLRCLAINAASLDGHHSDVAKTHLQAAEVYLILGDLRAARMHLELTAQAIGYAGGGASPWSRIQAWEDLAGLLDCKQRYYELMVEQVPRCADSVGMVLRERLALSEYRVTEPQWPEDRQFFVERAHSLYEEALDFLYARDSMGAVPMMFQIMERSKSRQLREAMLRDQAGHVAGVPDAVLAEEVILDEKIHALEKEQHALGVLDKSRREVDARLHAARMEKLHWVGALRSAYPRYHRLRYQADVAGLRDVQQRLNADEALISYFEGARSLYISMVTQGVARVVRVRSPQGISQLLRDFRSGIEGYAWRSQADPSQYARLSQQYVDAAHGLYQLLLAPLGDSLPQRLIVVPDGQIHHLPFDALLTHRAGVATAYGSHPYVVRRHTVHYVHSATLMLELGNLVMPNGKPRILAVAPSFDPTRPAVGDRVSFAPLRHNQEEAVAIQRIWRGDVLLGQAATRARFLAIVGNYDIVHLATHAQADDQEGDFSLIGFAGSGDSSLVHNHDLYTLQLGARLVVLSACESASGELRRGEGLVSLSRGFLYSGVAATLTSLWAVDDRNSQFVMQRFHEELRQGKSKDDALRRAKLSMLEEEDTAHPYYWAGLVPIGDMRPVTPSSSLLPWLVLLGIGVLLVASLRRW